MNATTMPVTNEMLYELLKTMQTQMNNIESRLSNVEARLSNIETRVETLEIDFKDFRKHALHRFDHIDRRLDKIEFDLEKIKSVQLELWESRKEVKLGFTRGLLMVNGLISVVLSTIIALAFNKTV